LSRLAYSTIKI